jgi:Fe-S-cluster containining protein
MTSNRSIPPRTIVLPAARAAAEAVWLKEARLLCQRIGVPQNLDEVASGLRGTRAFRHAFGEWESLPTRQRRKRWEELARATEKAAYATRPYCLRCGQCCTRQAPGLHIEDLPQVREGAIGPENLLTLRRGERAYSARLDKVIILQEEIVKVRPLPTGVCPYFQPEAHSCAVYERRPLPCRALKCWLPEAFAEATRSPHLTRADILAGDPLLELVVRQEQEAPLSALTAKAGRLDMTAVLAAVSKDDRLRKDALAAGLNADWLPFLLGRPLREAVSDLMAKSS